MQPESQKQEVGALLILVPPPFLLCMVTKHADRASLDSPVCAPASDASPQLQTKSVCPAHNSSCGLKQGSMCTNSVTDVQTFACAHSQNMNPALTLLLKLTEK